MENIFISVVMPNYNAAKYISQSIESVLNQTYKNFEFIIIDDCSTDDSWDIIQKYASVDSRIIALRNDKNNDISFTLNRGIAIAKADYIARFDSDDICDLHRFEKQINFLSKDENRDIGVLGANLRLIDPYNVCIGYKNFPEKHEDIVESMWYRNPFAHNSVIIKKSLFEKYGLYDISLNKVEDMDLWFRFMNGTRFYNMQEYLVSYRISGSNSVISNQNKMIDLTNLVKEKYHKDYNVKLPIKYYIFKLGSNVAKLLPDRLSFWIFNKIIKVYFKSGH